MKEFAIEREGSESRKSSVMVSVVPVGAGFQNDAMFKGTGLDGSSHSGNDHWLDVFVTLYRKAQEHNIALHTSDLLPPEKADIVLYMEMPQSPDEVLELKRRNPRVRTILWLLETSLGRRYVFNRRNHVLFDAIITYHPELIDDQRYFPFRYATGELSRIRDGLSFEQRQLACLIAGRSELRWRTGIGVIFRGWRFSLADWLDYCFCPGELLTARDRVAREFDLVSEHTCDLYGQGWDDERRPYKAARGILQESKLGLLGKYRFNICFENHLNDCGYVSEKIHDALFGDCVPVYLGNRSIRKSVPSECFVDASEYKSPKLLLQFLNSCPREKWERYRQAGREYLRSPMIRPFLLETGAEDLLRPILVLSGKHDRTTGSQ